MEKLNKKDAQKLLNCIENVKDDISAGIVITDKSFCCIGNKDMVCIAISAGLQKLVYDGDLEKEDIEHIFNSIEFDKKKFENDIESCKKELLKTLVDALNIDKKDIEEVLNEEK